MSLQIWLPLNGNLNNQGVSDATFSAYSNTTGIGVNTSGKLGGSCYERTAAAANGYRSSRTFLMDKDVSELDIPEDEVMYVITNTTKNRGTAGMFDFDLFDKYYDGERLRVELGLNYNLDATKYVGMYVAKDVVHSFDSAPMVFGLNFGIDF